MAKNRTNTEATKRWHKDWGVGMSVWIERRGQKVLTEPAAALLQALDKTRSISGAARLLGVSYRHAWMSIQQANENAGAPLIETAIGGGQGGGTELTDYGRAALQVFQQIQQQLHSAAAKSLPRVLTTVTRDRDVVHLAAAISLQEVVSQIVTEFSLARPTITVATLFGASNEIAEQIEQGAAVDLFIAAGKEPIDRISRSGLVQPKSRRSLARNGLAVIATPALEPKIRQIGDIVKSKDITLVVADSACPLGNYTHSYLKKSKTYDALKSQLRTVGNSRAVIAELRGVTPRVGVIFSSDINNAEGLNVLFQPKDTDDEILYQAVVTLSQRDTAPTLELLAFLQSESASRLWKRWGFVPLSK